MKQKLLFFITLFIFSFSTLKAKETNAAKKQNKVTVKDIITNSKKYVNKNISLNGVVIRVDSKKSMFILEDDCSSCGASCVTYQLPVQSNGLKLPKVGEKLNISGKINKIDGKYRFILKELKTIK